MKYLTLILALLAMIAPAQAQNTLVADLDQQEVSINTGFNGAELLLFGALRLQDTDDIVIVVSGPGKDIALRRKDKVAGIWVNTENANLISVPSFYRILSTRPLEQVTTLRERKRIKLGYEHIPFVLASGSRIEEGTHLEWQIALRRNMETIGLWGREAGEISVREDVLFRTNLTLPANIIPGLYNVRIIHFRDGRMINEDLSTLMVAKRGFSAGVYDIAHRYAAFYGIFAVCFAMATGWLGAALFRR